MAYIEFKNVVKQFGKNTVLNEINLDINKGELVTLLGPSGCGKSTLLRCLSGLETVTSGQIILDGQNITNMPASQRNIGMVFQQYSLFPNMNVEQNIAFGLKMQNAPPTRSRKKCATPSPSLISRARKNPIRPTFPAVSSNAWRGALHRHRAKGAAPRRTAHSHRLQARKERRHASARTISSWD